MKCIAVVLIFVCFGTASALAQADTVISRIVLIGDGGQLTKGKHVVADAVRRNVKLDQKTLVLYLGDNLYRVGLPDDAYIGYQQAKSVLDSQLSVVENTPARVIVIPGNHDWNNGWEGWIQFRGEAAILRGPAWEEKCEVLPRKWMPGSR